MDITKCGEEITFSQFEPIFKGGFLEYARNGGQKPMGFMLVAYSGIGKTESNMCNIRWAIASDTICNHTVYHIDKDRFGGTEDFRLAVYSSSGAAQDPFNTLIPALKPAVLDPEKLPKHVMQCLKNAEKKGISTSQRHLWRELALQTMPRNIDAAMSRSFTQLTVDGYCDGLLLNVEDINRADKRMENIYKGILDRKIGDNIFGCYPFTICSANPTGNVTEMDFPLLSSMGIFYIKIDREFVEKHGHKWFHPAIHQFMKKYPDYIFQKMNEGKIESLPCPRKWEHLSAFFNCIDRNEIPKESLPYLCTAYVGEAVAQKLLLFLKENHTYEIPSQIILTSPKKLVSIVVDSEDPVHAVSKIARDCIGKYVPQCDNTKWVKNLADFAEELKKASSSTAGIFMQHLFQNKDMVLRTQFSGLFAEVDSKEPEHVARLLEVYEDLTKID